jgi:hypothetical protein
MQLCRLGSDDRGPAPLDARSSPLSMAHEDPINPKPVEDKAPLHPGAEAPVAPPEPPPVSEKPLGTPVAEEACAQPVMPLPPPPRFWPDELATLSTMGDFRPLMLEDSKGQRVTALVEHQRSPALDQMVQMVRDRLHCNACARRTSLLGRLGNGREPLFLQRAKLDRLPTEVREWYEKLATLNEEACRAPPEGISIVVGELVKGIRESEGPFSHYHVQVPADCQGQIKSRTALTYEKAIHRYAPDILPRMLSALLPEDSRPRHQVGDLLCCTPP